MVFTDIRVQNYRSYKDSSFELGGGVTIVVGPNATGKSNLIEALLLVANGTKYRGKNGLIRNGSPWARIDVHTAKNNSRTVKITSDNNQTSTTEYTIDNKNYKRLPYTQKQPAVIFEPNNLLLLHGEPQNRREYLDNLSSQISSGFNTERLKYKRTLAQRNALLKNRGIDNTQLFVWNIRLSELAESIVKQRTLTIELINKHLSNTYSSISTKKSNLQVIYKTPLNPSNYSASLLNKLERDMVIDKERGFTGSGPHREDFEVFYNKKPVSLVASRGEIRTLLLALKIIELELLEERTDNPPLLLLDDVFSELDGARRKALTKFLDKYQTIITTTDADIILKNFSQNCQIIPLG